MELRVTWPEQNAADPIIGADFPGHSSYANNVMYTFHFYAGSHTPKGLDPESLGLPDGGEVGLDWQPNADPFNRLTTCLNKNTIGIFATEWGTTLYDGGQPSTSAKAYTLSCDQWLSFLKEKNISWCNWSISDKNEGASILPPGSSVYGRWSSTVYEWNQNGYGVTPSGRYVRDQIRK